MKKSLLANLVLLFSLILICSCEKNENQIPIGAAPISDFSADTIEITTGTQIEFTDQSANNPTSWSWDFGDGVTSTLQNPSHTYSSIGNYTVTLTSTNSYGSDSESKPNYITVLQNIVTGTFTDSRDGKTYKTVQIGNQVWMAENLNYESSSGSWVYDNNTSYASTYGRLYDWETANSACPGGWHLPSDNEWKQLEMAIGMSQSDADLSGWRGSEGYKLRATSGWMSNGNGTDEYGFTVLPGGFRHDDDDFIGEGYSTYFWSSTMGRYNCAWSRLITNDCEYVYRYDYFTDQEYGFSVRCVKD